MIYMHFCKNCSYLHMLNGHKMKCPKCDNTLTELTVPYLDYVNMNLEERALLLEQCKDEKGLAKISTVYRMYKYSKAYRLLRQQNTVAADGIPTSRTEPPQPE